MPRHYNHLSAEERAVVQIEIQDGKSMRSIARRLGRSPSTLSRKVARQGAGAYSATEAGKNYRARRLRSVRHRRLIKGAFNRSCVGTLVERKTRFVILCKMDGCTAEAALEGFSRQLKKLPESMRTSLTYDRGTELTCYPELMDRLAIDVWFADPHAPWHRGSNENTNGLLRQFLPKGVDLSSASQEYLNHVAMLMNTRPRQTLGWKTPAEVMDKEIAEFRSRVALAS
ncbi:IS30 family transposase [Pseudomonas fluorescens]|uniref:IS30 family transposase n=1 Tax=Pseudomonas fluorescens TaxID=294 RepID=UPI000936D590|nr:IS30 family transposase [Pseudomonas fluorescens]